MNEAPRQPHSNALPNYEAAVIPPEKLTMYALNPTHTTHVWGKSSGSDKARVFKSVLGFDKDNWDLLRERVLAELPFHEAAEGHKDEYGQRYTVVMPITGANGRTADVLTAWIIRSPGAAPTLTTIRVVL